MNRLKKYSALLTAIQSVDPKTRVGILRSAPDEFIKTLLEVVVNFLAGNVVNPSHNPSNLNKLRRHKSLLRRLGAQRSMKNTRKLLVKQKGGFLPLLLAPLIAGVGLAAAAPAIARKVSANAAEGAVNTALDTVEKRVKGSVGELK